jgi:hypothetical protein
MLFLHKADHISIPQTQEHMAQASSPAIEKNIQACNCDQCGTYLLNKELGDKEKAGHSLDHGPH